MLNNNWLALVVTFLAALAWLRINDFSAHRGWISSRVSRKIIHIGTGPIFVLCWLLFNQSPYSRFLAALVPLSITAQFVLVGLGVIRDESAVQAMSRTGDRREILRGPLFYGIAFVLLTILFWTDSPVGMTALMVMCGGDGLADIVGRSYGKTRLPWNRNKTLQGSLTVLFAGYLLAAVVLGVYLATGVFTDSPLSYALALAIISLVSTLVESLPLKDVDNLTVTAAAVLVGLLIF